MVSYKDEWLALLLKQKLQGWLIASDRNHIFINVPDDQDLDVAMQAFQTLLGGLKIQIKSKPTKLGFFLGNSIDSKFYELS
ncbi:hypothetical protein ACVWYN_002961 [Pedobacter sp. UYP24]